MKIKAKNSITGYFETHTTCDSCQLIRINGLVCHETGCTDAWRDVKRSCYWCGSLFLPEIKEQRFCSESCQDSTYDGLLAENTGSVSYD